MRNISPKVLWPVVLGLVLSSLLTNINLITPDMLNFLGPWKFFVLQVLTTVLGGVVGFMATDPARKLAEAPQNPDDGSYKITNLPDLYTAPETKFPVDAVAAAQAAAEPIPYTPIAEAPV